MHTTTTNEVREDSQDRWPLEWRAGLVALAEHDPARACVVYGASIATGANLLAEYEAWLAARPGRSDSLRRTPLFHSPTWRWLPQGGSGRTLDLGIEPHGDGVRVMSSGGGSWYGKGTFGATDAVPGLYLVTDRAPEHLRTEMPCSHMATWLRTAGPGDLPELLCAAHGAAWMARWAADRNERTAGHDARCATIDEGRTAP
jgi:hypothetical protein